MGEAVRDRVDHLTGVELSAGMIAGARERGHYDALDVAEATAFLARSAPGVYDCILAADALCYFGDLKPILAACGRALGERGLFAFTIETFEGDGFRLQATMRFAHSRASLEAAAAEVNRRPLLMCATSTRREAAVDVPGLIAVFQKEAGSRLARRYRCCSTYL